MRYLADSAALAPHASPGRGAPPGCGTCQRFHKRHAATRSGRLWRLEPFPSPLLPSSPPRAARTRFPHLLPRFALAKTVSTGAAQMRSAVARLIRSSSSASRLRWAIPSRHAVIFSIAVDGFSWVMRQFCRPRGWANWLENEPRFVW